MYFPEGSLVIVEYSVISIHVFQKYRISAMSIKIVASIMMLQMVLHATNAGKGRFRRLIFEEMILEYSLSPFGDVWSHG